MATYLSLPGEDVGHPVVSEGILPVVKKTAKARLVLPRAKHQVLQKARGLPARVFDPSIGWTWNPTHKELSTSVLRSLDKLSQ